MVIHADPENGVQVEDNVSVGHGAVLHGCKIQDNVLIGMNSTVLNGAEVKAIKENAEEYVEMAKEYREEMKKFAFAASNPMPGNNFYGGKTMEKTYSETTYSKTPDAGAELHPEAGTVPEYRTEKTGNRRKSPVLAALLSLIIPGLGQVYAGDLYRGIALIAALGISLCLIALFIGFFTFFATWIFAVSDAYKMVNKQNDGVQKKRNRVSV